MAETENALIQIKVKGTLDGKKLTATLPAKRPLVFFFLVRDERGATTTSRHVILPKVSAE